ncbi:MAG: hypothetical protein WCA46_18950 [Actinocatenispora sp.]
MLGGVQRSSVPPRGTVPGRGTTPGGGPKAARPVLGQSAGRGGPARPGAAQSPTQRGPKASEPVLGGRAATNKATGERPGVRPKVGLGEQPDPAGRTTGRVLGSARKDADPALTGSANRRNKRDRERRGDDAELEADEMWLVESPGTSVIEPDDEPGPATAGPAIGRR